MRTPHTAAYRGKRVMVVMRSGQRFVAKFKDRDAHSVTFDDRIVVRSQIKSFSIVKGNPVIRQPKGLY